MFVEDADSATLDLSGMPSQQPLAVFDAQADYNEIDRGSLGAGVHIVQLGRTSDWALAIGDFRSGKLPGERE